MAFDKNESGVRTDESGRVVSVKLDRHITDPDHPDAVQVTSDAAPQSPMQDIADALSAEEAVEESDESSDE